MLMSGRREGRREGRLCVDQPQVKQTTSFRTLRSQVLRQDILRTRRTLRFFVGHRPPHVYPHVYLTSRTLCSKRAAFPNRVPKIHKCFLYLNAVHICLAIFSRVVLYLNAYHNRSHRQSPWKQQAQESPVMQFAQDGSSLHVR